MLHQEIVSRLQEARRNKQNVALTLLTTLVGEIDNAARKGTAFSEDDVIKILKKFLKDNKFSQEQMAASDPRLAVLREEEVILNSLLPKVDYVSDEELNGLVAVKFNSGIKNPNQMLGVLIKEYGQRISPDLHKTKIQDQVKILLGN